MKDQASTMQTIEPDVMSNERSIATKSPMLPSGKLQETFQVGLSHTERLLDESIQHLTGLLKGKDIVVQEACLCAHQIANLARTKIELLKLKNYLG